MRDDFRCSVCDYPTYQLNAEGVAFCGKTCFFHPFAEQPHLVYRETEPPSVVLRVFPFMQKPVRLPLIQLLNAVANDEFELVERLLSDELALPVYLETLDFFTILSSVVIAGTATEGLPPREQFRQIIGGTPAANNADINLRRLIREDDLVLARPAAQYQCLLEALEEARDIGPDDVFLDVAIAPPYIGLFAGVVHHHYHYDTQPLHSGLSPLPDLRSAGCDVRIYVRFEPAVREFDEDAPPRARCQLSELDPFAPIFDMEKLDDFPGTYGIENFGNRHSINVVARTTPDEGGEIVGYITGHVASRYQLARSHPELNLLLKTVSDAQIEKALANLSSTRLRALFRNKLNNVFIVDGLYVREKFRRLNVASILTIHLVEAVERNRIVLDLSHIMLDSFSMATRVIFERLGGYYFGEEENANYDLDDFYSLKRVSRLYSSERFQFNTLCSLEDPAFIEALTASIETFNECRFAYQQQPVVEEEPRRKEAYRIVDGDLIKLTCKK